MISTNVEIDSLPYVLRDYICKKSGLDTETPDKAMCNLGKWPKLICDDNGIKTLKHTDTISYKDFYGNALDNIAHLKTVINFSNQGKSKIEVGYNRPLGMNNLKTTVYYQAHPYG